MITCGEESNCALLEVMKCFGKLTLVLGFVSAMEIISSSYRVYHIEIEDTGHHESYEAAVIRVSFAGPLFYNGSAPLSSVLRFMDVHHAHKQLLYDVASLECPGFLVFPSHPVPLDHSILYPLPFSPYSKKKWLNALSRELFAPHEHFPDNILMFGIQLDEILTESMLDSCTLSLGSHDNWYPKRFLTDYNGVHLDIQGIQLHSWQNPKHIHLFDDAMSQHVSDMPSVYLQESTQVGSIPFLDLLLPPMLSDILPPLIQYVTNKMAFTIQNSIIPNIIAYTSGSSGPGAKKADISGLGAGLVPSPPGPAAMLIEQYAYFGDGEGSTPETLRFQQVRSQLLHMSATRSGILSTKPTPDGELNKNIAIELINSLTISLTQDMHEDLLESICLVVILYSNLFLELSAELKAFMIPTLHRLLTQKVSDPIAKVVTPALDKILSETIPTMLHRTMNAQMVRDVLKHVVPATTRAVAHSVTPSITLSLKYARSLAECIYSPNADPSSCTPTFTVAAENLYYSDFYCSYYSDAAVANYTDPEINAHLEKAGLV